MQSEAVGHWHRRALICWLNVVSCTSSILFGCWCAAITLSPAAAGTTAHASAGSRRPPIWGRE